MHVHDHCQFHQCLDIAASGDGAVNVPDQVRQLLTDSTESAAASGLADLLDSALQHVERDGLPMEPVPAHRNQYEANGTHRSVSTSVARRRHG